MNRKTPTPIQQCDAGHKTPDAAVHCDAGHQPCVLCGNFCEHVMSGGQCPATKRESK